MVCKNINYIILSKSINYIQMISVMRMIIMIINTKNDKNIKWKDENEKEKSDNEIVYENDV